METSAQIIASTMNPWDSNRIITTVQVTMPRYLLAELNTHRLLTKSAESTRAIPLKKRIEMVKNHPFVPSRFGKNKAGMSPEEDLDADVAELAEKFWRLAAESAVTYAEALKNLGGHKTWAGRILEPFAYVRAVITATEWTNFLNLRKAPEADPEFQVLANKIDLAILSYAPKPSKYHLPYIEEDLLESDLYSLDQLMKISAARCARISYKPYTETKPNPKKDLELAEQKLIPHMHLSPFDHVAIATKKFKHKDTRQYHGWIPYRVELEKTEYCGVEFNSKEKSRHWTDFVNFPKRY